MATTTIAPSTSLTSYSTLSPAVSATRPEPITYSTPMGAVILDAIRAMTTTERDELRTLLALEAEVDEVLTAEEAASRLKSHPETIRRACRDGALPAAKIGSSWRVKASDLEAWSAAPRTNVVGMPRRRSRRSGERPIRHSWI